MLLKSPKNQGSIMASGNKKRAKDGTERGRPPGSPNKDYIRCVTVPAKCGKCGSTEFAPRQHIVSREIGGVIDGKEYNCVSHYRTRCANEACEQACVIIEYRLIHQGTEESGYDDSPEEFGEESAT